MKPVRCAIYTRKSSDEGLEQSFNSLDAQREACAAYILSQASEGWVALPDIYDDGGLSGGSLERPALQRLLTEVTMGRVDIIVVYKVDRLTRSLFDFAKLVEQFDATGTSFVSITQSFNTTTSMGRLTLNMLLSFAQFEREVTAERIRDKIAASKARGMWMGGNPPIGYRPKERSLEIVEADAAIIRDIFGRYLRLGNVRLVEGELVRSGIRTPGRVTTTGRKFGNAHFSRGQIYAILKNTLYIGVIEHNGKTYPALHQPIIDRDTWEYAQAKLAENLQGRRTRSYAKSASLLAGKVVDEDGNPLIATHANKGTARYRYYVSDKLHHHAGDGMRIPARELEAVVAQRVAEEFGDPLALAARCNLALRPEDFRRLKDWGEQDVALLLAGDRDLARAIVEQVRVKRDAIEIECATGAIAGHLGVPVTEGDASRLRLTRDARVQRSGRVVKLVRDNGQAVIDMPNASLVRLVARAHRWWRELRKGEANISELAAREQVSSAYLTRVLRLAFLSPKVTDMILTGAARNGTSGAQLIATDAIVAGWADQERLLLASTA